MIVLVYSHGGLLVIVLVYSHGGLLVIVLAFLLDLMRSMTTTSKIVIKIITTMLKAPTTPPKRLAFNWVPV